MESSHQDHKYRVEYLQDGLTISTNALTGKIQEGYSAVKNFSPRTLLGSHAAEKSVISMNEVSKEISMTGKMQGAFSAVKNFSPKTLLGKFSNRAGNTVEAVEKTVETAGKTVKAAEKSVQAAEKTTSVLGKVAPHCTKVLTTASAITTAYEVSKSALKDYEQGTKRNTVTTTSSIGGRWVGGLAGAKAGAALGTLVSPGIGTVVGVVIGAISGQIGGAKVTEKIVDVVADAKELDIDWFSCVLCKVWYKCRLYTGQSREFCPDCELLNLEWSYCELCQQRFLRKKESFTYYCGECDSLNSNSDFLPIM